MGMDTKPTVLILGANGMLGHKLYQVLSKDFRVWGTVRCDIDEIERYGFLKRTSILECKEVSRGEEWWDILSYNEFDIVINCIGIVDKSQNIYDMIKVNSIFPMQLKNMCGAINARLIHISTDCVFSGNDGNYEEGSPADAIDAYGKTKWLGEVTGDNVLTIRTSIIGRELVRSRGLLEWFISQQGKTVKGFSNAIFTGFPTVTFADIIKDIILNYPKLHGLYHIASEPIDKYTLLSMLNNAMGLNISILKDMIFHCDRSLDATKFNKVTGFTPLPWPTMINELAEDVKQYSAWR